MIANGRECDYSCPMKDFLCRPRNHYMSGICEWNKERGAELLHNRRPHFEFVDTESSGPKQNYLAEDVLCEHDFTSVNMDHQIENNGILFLT